MEASARWSLEDWYGLYRWHCGGRRDHHFRDGRRVSFLLERRIAYEVLNGSLPPSEGAGYDVLDSEDQKWEVRSVSLAGIYFCPSYMVGSGRKFEELGFLTKMDEIAGYVVSDIQRFPAVPYWIIPVDIVREWWQQRKDFKR